MPRADSRQHDPRRGEFKAHDQHYSWREVYHVVAGEDWGHD